MTRDEFVEYIKKLGYKEVNLGLAVNTSYEHPEDKANPIVVKRTNVGRLHRFENGTIVSVEHLPFRESAIFEHENRLRKRLINLHERIKLGNGPLILDPTDQDDLDEFLSTFLYD